MTRLEIAVADLDVADLDDAALTERFSGLKAIRDQAQSDSESAQRITLAMFRKLASTVGERIWVEGCGYRRDHLQALAQRVDVADREVRIRGSKGN